MWIVMAGPARIASAAAVTVRWQEPAAPAPSGATRRAGPDNASAFPTMSPAHGSRIAGSKQPVRARQGGNP
jgi:hypothetical protein